jgi:hypothetical protein
MPVPKEATSLYGEDGSKDTGYSLTNNEYGTKGYNEDDEDPINPPVF